jgi:hypothetical protein
MAHKAKLNGQFRSESSGHEDKSRLQNGIAGRYNYVEVGVEIILRPTVSRSVRLGVRHPSGIRDQFFFLLDIFFRQLGVCYFVAPSLTKRRVCNLLLLVVLASAVPLGPQSRETETRILSQSLGLPTWRAKSRIPIPQEHGGPDMPPGTGFPFRRLLRLAGLRWRYYVGTRRL